jgi:hypothetical protein
VAALQGLCDPGVVPGGTARGLVGLQEDAGAGAGAGGAVTGRDELGQVLALLGGPLNEVTLGRHGGFLPGMPAGKRTQGPFVKPGVTLH